MTAVQHTSGRTVNRLSHLNTSSGDLLNKLEAVRLVCQETGCAQRYLTHDAVNAIAQVSARIDDARGTTEHTDRFLNYLHRIQDQDLTLGVAMTDAKGDRSRRPHEQANRDSYVHVVERNARGHRHQRHQGHRHRRALHARTAGDALPQHGPGRRRLRGLLRRAHRRTGPDHRRPPRRAARRKARTRRRAVQPQIRPEHRGLHLRPGVRALGPCVLRRRMGALRPPHLQLRHPPPPHLHRARARALATC